MKVTFLAMELSFLFPIFRDDIIPQYTTFLPRVFECSSSTMPRHMHCVLIRSRVKESSHRLGEHEDIIYNIIAINR
jgi:hypothetical protein